MFHVTCAIRNQHLTVTNITDILHQVMQEVMPEQLGPSKRAQVRARPMRQIVSEVSCFHVNLENFRGSSRVAYKFLPPRTGH